MIKKIEGSDVYLGLAGYKEAVITHIDTILNESRSRFKDVELQFFDADLICGWEHLYFAVLNALKACKNRLNIAKNVAMETLLFAAAETQISHALEVVGMSEDSSRIVVSVLGRRLRNVKQTLLAIPQVVSCKRDDGVIELNEVKFEKIKNLFGITETEFNSKVGVGEEQALKELVIEHVALSAVQR